MNKELFKAGGSTNNNTIFVNVNNIEQAINKENQQTQDYKDQVVHRRLKELINISELDYVSGNINNLLDLKFQNKGSCLKDACKSPHRAIRDGDGYRVILYIRLSVEDGDLIDDKDISRSIKNQLILLLDEAIVKKWVVVGIFCDEDYSGADDDRPEWNTLLKFAENKWTDIILCKTQSRFTRSMEMVEKYLHNKFNEWNIRFVSIVDRTDTADKNNKKSRQINGLVNEWALEDQSENTRKTLTSMKKNGQYTGSFAPFGYVKDPKDKYHLIIDEQAAKTVRMIFDMYKQGKGYHYITKILNQKKILTPSQYKKISGSKYVCTKIRDINTVYWCRDSVRKILTDETYIGTLVQHKVEGISYKNRRQRPIPKEDWIRVPNCHQQIIDLDTWRSVSQKFIGRNKITKSGVVHLFSQKVYCSCCNSVFHRNVYNTAHGKRAYLQCKTRKTTGGIKCDNKASVKIDSLEELILKQINEQLKKYYRLYHLQKGYDKRLVLETIEEEKFILEKEKGDLFKTLENKSSIFTTLYDDRINGIISVDEFGILRKKYTDEISQYKSRINQIEDEVNEIQNKQSEQIDLRKLLGKYRHIKKLDRIIIDEFISKIMIGKIDPKTKTRQITIIWEICSK